MVTVGIFKVRDVRPRDGRDGVSVSLLLEVFSVDLGSVFGLIDFGVVATSGNGVAFRFKGASLPDFRLLEVSFLFALFEISSTGFTSPLALPDAS